MHFKAYSKSDSHNVALYQEAIQNFLQLFTQN